MICQRMMVGQQDGDWAEWRFHVNSGTLKKTGIPVSLYEQSGIVINVNWGDGTNDILTDADYTNSDATSSVHTYSEDGIYEIIVRIKHSEALFLQYDGHKIDTDNNEYNKNLYYFRKTLVSVDSAIPLVAGVERYYRNNWQKTAGELTRLFFYCDKLTFVATDTFFDNPQITNIGYQFYHSPLSDFTLRFSAAGITSAERFCTDASSGVTRTVYVPSGSTTETTFNAVASSLGLTIIGE